MNDVTVRLPKRMVRYGCELHSAENGPVTKFVLSNKKYKYRSFLYLNTVYDRKAEARLDDLYSNFYYETGLLKVYNYEGER